MCRTGTVRGQAKKNNVSIPRKTGKSTIVTHGTIRVKMITKYVESLICISQILLLITIELGLHKVELLPNLKSPFN